MFLVTSGVEGHMAHNFLRPVDAGKLAIVGEGILKTEPVSTPTPDYVSQGPEIPLRSRALVGVKKQPGKLFAI